MTMQKVQIEPKGTRPRVQGSKIEKHWLPSDYERESVSWRYGYTIGERDIVVGTIGENEECKAGEVPNNEVNAERRALRAAEDATEHLRDIGSMDGAYPWVQEQRRKVIYTFEPSRHPNAKKDPDRA